MISFVIPVYFTSPSESGLTKLIDRITAICKQIDSSFEIILVDDACPSNSWDHIQKLCVKMPAIVKGIKHSRNFGQQNAITTGLSMSSGEWMVVMDCDFQDDPEAIFDLWAKKNEGFDYVVISRFNRQDSFLKKSTSYLFWRLFSFLTNTTLDGSVANYGIYNRKVINAYLSINDQIKSFPAHVNWLGFNRATIEYQHQPRLSGKSSYSIAKMFILATNTILNFSDRPLWLIAQSGLWISALSMSTALCFFIGALLDIFVVQGWAGIIVSIWIFSGLIIFLLGIIGLYVSKTFEQTKNRPTAIISEQIGFEREELK